MRRPRLLRPAVTFVLALSTAAGAQPARTEVRAAFGAATDYGAPGGRAAPLAGVQGWRQLASWPGGALGVHLAVEGTREGADRGAGVGTWHWAGGAEVQVAPLPRARWAELRLAALGGRAWQGRRDHPTLAVDGGDHPLLALDVGAGVRRGPLSAALVVRRAAVRGVVFRAPDCAPAPGQACPLAIRFEPPRTAYFTRVALTLGYGLAF